jgi:hypothetical protein
VGVCIIAGGKVTGITVGYEGTGYSTPPDVTILGDGTGAQIIAVVDGGGVTSYVVKQYGKGYTKALVQLTGGNNGASAKISLMPFGLSGTTMETFNGQIWNANGGAVAEFPPKNRVIFSAPGSASDLDPTAGGGAFQSNNATLRVGYHVLKQANGFLYLIGDSGVDQISGVQTAPAPNAPLQSITTFSNINVDPQTGTPWPSSVQVFNRDVIFANTLGIHVCYGGQVTKISDPLDGFYASGPIFGKTANFPSAVAQIFGRYVYMLLLPFIDAVTQQLVTKLIMWDGKRFWTSAQDASLTYIFTEEINSVLTAWGTDGTNLFPLFQRPTVNFTKTIQSRLWAVPGYHYTKMAMQLLGVVNYYTGPSPMTVSIDNEKTLGLPNVVSGLGGLTWTNNTGAPIAWTNNAGQPIVWGSAGLNVFGPQPAGGIGRFIGMTAVTNTADMALLSLMLAEQVASVMP